MRNVKNISFALIILSRDLAARNLRAIGTVRSNRTECCSLGVAKKDERASYDYKSDGTVLFVRWKDNSIVTIGTHFSKVSQLIKSQDE